MEKCSAPGSDNAVELALSHRSGHVTTKEKAVLYFLSSFAYQRSASELPFGVEIKNLSYHKGFEFDCYYKTARIGDAGIPINADNILEIIDRTDFFIPMSTSRDNNPSRARSIDFLIKQQSLEQQKDALWAKYSSNTVLNLSYLLHPGFGAALNAMAAINSGEGHKIQKNSIDYGENVGILKGKYYTDHKEELRSALTVAAAYSDYLKEHKSVNETIDNGKWKDKMEWFGAGGSFAIDGKSYLAFQGLYHPEALRAVYDWEQKGISSLLPVTEEDLKAIRREMDRKITEDYEKELGILLNGDKNQTGAILQMDQKAFEKVVRGIEKAYDKADLGDNTSLQVLFYNKYKGE